MKYYTAFVLYFTIVLYLPAAGSRHYQPVSEWENQFYQQIDKNIWPDDVRVNIELYKNLKIGWVGIVEKYMTDFSNEEYNLIGFYVKHHYYDWIEEVGRVNKPINLSPDGEGYFICYYLFRKDVDQNEIMKDFTDDLIINYGSPIKILEDGIIELSTDYMRIIDKEHVNSNWLNYGRNGLGEKIIYE
jgi:hypothetical protein